MLIFRDQMGNCVRLPAIPRRIISLVPSVTELLFDLELEAQVAGVTQHCILPQKGTVAKPKVGQTRQLDFKTIDQLKPDLILASKEENEREEVMRLMRDYPVWVGDITGIDATLEMIRVVGKITGRASPAAELAAKIQKSLDSLSFPSLPRAAYLVWKKPWMAAGGGTFTDAMLRKAGFCNIFAGRSRYPQVSLEELAGAQAVLLSSEPYAFTPAHAVEMKKYFPAQSILLVDGMMFCWYGSRMLHAAEYFRELRQALDAGGLFVHPNTGQ